MSCLPEHDDSVNEYSSFFRESKSYAIEVLGLYLEMGT